VVLFVAASPASAKFKVSLSADPRVPAVGEPVQVAIRTATPQEPSCRMRLLAVAPGVDRSIALAAFITGGTSIMGISGPTFRRIEPTPRMGSLVGLRRMSLTAWRATVRFTRLGGWQLVVPNWCAPGYASRPPALLRVSVRAG
jgi:hypothetical protein